MFRWPIIIILLAVIHSPANAGKLTTTSISKGVEAEDTRAAVSVNGHVFTVAQVKAVAMREQGDAVLDRLIDNMLLDQSGQKIDVSSSRKEVESTWSRLRSQARIVRNFHAMEPPYSEIAATVNGIAIPITAVEAEAMKIAAANVVDRFINNELTEQEARRQGIVVTSAEVAAQLETLRKAIAPMTLAEGLKRHHQTIPMLTQDIIHSIQRQKLVEKTTPAPQSAQALIPQYMEGLRAKAAIVISLNAAQSSLPAVSSEVR